MHPTAHRMRTYAVAPPPQCASLDRSIRRIGADELSRLHRACRVFLARLLIVYGTDAPEVLRRMADELEELEAEQAAD